MNLWRLPIDEASGRVSGEPEPVTTPSNWSGFVSFSRDGLTMAFASLDWRSTLLRQPFDAAREMTIGPPTPLLRGSRPIRDHAVSPDGQWIAFNETAAREAARTRLLAASVHEGTLSRQWRRGGGAAAGGPR